MNPNQQARYLRQVIFPPLGPSGQDKLLASRVLLVGCGATGSVIADLLARAGVGYLRLADRDFVELSNLQRQILFDEDDVAVGLPKAIAAARKLARINPTIAVEPVVADVNAANVEDLMTDVDLILDGCDNFQTRYLLNDACVKHGKPWIYGGAVASYGSTMTILPGTTACFRCVFPKAPPPGALATCDTAGVIAPIATIIGSFVAAEALKLLAHSGPRHEGLLHLDVWENTFETLVITRRADCACCVLHHFEYLDESATGATAVQLCGRNAVQIRPAGKHRLDLAPLAERLAPLGTVSHNEYLLQFKIGEYDLTLFPDARAIIKGTEDESIARALYARYVGI